MLLLAPLQGGLQIPAPVGVVNDFAHVIEPDQARLIEQIAQDVRTKSRGEIAVVTMPSEMTGDREIADVALQIGREWKVGKIGAPGDPTRNAGAVILIFPKKSADEPRRQRCWVATGNGAEGFITDADAGDICRAATPLFADQQYGPGIRQVTYQVAQRFASEFGFTVDSTLRPPEYAPMVDERPVGRSRGIPPQFIFLAIVFFLLFFGRGRRGGCGGCLPLFIPFGGGGLGGGGGWSGGSSGGGFGGGGGGGFGGFGGGGGFSGGGGGSSW